jgi:hypothetical protein
MSAAFHQFTHDRPCPACGGVHQVDMVPAVIERQPRLFNFTGRCWRAGRDVLMLGEAGRLHSLAERIGLGREALVMHMILGGDVG